MHFLFNLIAHTSELSQHLFLRTLESIWIVKANVQTFSHFAYEHRTLFVRSPTDSNHIIPWITQIRVNVLRIMFGDVNAYLCHHLDS